MISTFQISPTDVLKKTIVFQCWDSDLGKDDPLGEVTKTTLIRM